MSLVAQQKIESANVGFHTSFMKTFMGTNDELRELAMPMDSDTEVEEHHWVSLPPPLTRWRDQRKLGKLRRQKLRIENEDWASGIQIHRNTILDDKLGTIWPSIRQFGRRAAQSYGNLIVDALIAGFEAGGVHPTKGSRFGTAYDGQPFFSDAHQDADDTPTWSNLGTAAFSKDAYIAARAQGRSITDDEGEGLGIVYDTLIVGPGNEQAAIELAQSTIILTNDGTYGAAATNVNRDQIRRVIISDKLVGAFANYWFAADLTNEVRALILQIREQITTSMIPEDGNPTSFSKSEALFMSKVLKFGAEGRHNVGYAEPRVMFGSKGEGAG